MLSQHDIIIAWYYNSMILSQYDTITTWSCHSMIPSEHDTITAWYYHSIILSNMFTIAMIVNQSLCIFLNIFILGSQSKLKPIILHFNHAKEESFDKQAFSQIESFQIACYHKKYKITSYLLWNQIPIDHSFRKTARFY